MFYRISFGLMKVRVISVFEYLARQLSVYTQGCIKVVPNGINFTKFYHEEKSRFLSERKTQAVIVLYARSDYRKGLDIGIKAIEELKRIRGGKDWELWTIGDNTLDIHLGGVRINKKGFLNDDDLRAVLSAADIYLSPSRHEGFGLMQLEAMACGCVMVTTKAFPLAEDDVNSLVSQVEDWQSLARNLDRVLGDKELRERLKQNGFKLVKDYSIDKSCAQFEKTLLDLYNSAQPQNSR
jgi:glycosyltransferase involved in cell wall biosynthesis